ncbi:MAG TPA: biopolymer transporter ExbD [Rhizomicrobium sp.]|jgi:biopolymer transport protein ExbD|nr:biopolymer transporter ExbD [Rhizomicrobium sp.]
MNRVTAILYIIFAATFAWHFFPASVAFALTTDIALRIEKDGSVTWNRTHFTDMTQLQSALAPLCAQKTKPNIRVVTAEKPAKFELVGRVIAVGQKADCFKVGFLTMPPP